MYLWLKAGHLIAMISWMAGMLYLPRLFVYHAMAAKGSEQSETFKVMECRLLKIIMTPAMLLTWVFGLALVLMGGWFTSLWFLAKLALVVAMSVVHGMMSAWVGEFATDSNRRTPKFYRIVNEVPTVLLILIVLLVVLKRF